MDNTTEPSCSEIYGTETSNVVDSVWTMDDNGVGEAESKVDKVTRKK